MWFFLSNLYFLYVWDYKATLSGATACKGLGNSFIRCDFILDHSPWWRGFYKRLIGTTKSCLKKVIGKARLNLEELTAISAVVEAAINSRRLTYNDDDPSNNTLTPNQLI